jgi:ribonuclease BN (tRNA processing enzyme)
MRVKLLSSAHGSLVQYASSYLINDTIAIDAGSLGFWGMPEQQAQVHHIFLTHSHADHIASLPVFIENVYGLIDPGAMVYANAYTLKALEQDVFNDRIWPDFVELSRLHPPFLTLQELLPERQVAINGLRITPVPVHHAVPTFGYIVTDGKSTVVFGADSGPTERIWQLARESSAPHTVILEASFPNSMAGLAKISAHLTPELFAEELCKLPAGSRVLTTHIKTRFREEMLLELAKVASTAADNGITVELAEPDLDYHL